MYPRGVILMMMALAAAAALGATARAGRGAGELPALAARAVADVAAREGVAPGSIRVLRAEARPSGTERPGACLTGPGYRIVLVANNARYEYDGSRDCIVMAPRESRPSGQAVERAEARPTAGGVGARQAVATLRTSSQVPSLESLPIAGTARHAAPPEAPPRAGGDRSGAAAPEHATLAAFRLVGASAEQVEALRPWRSAAHDSFYRLHLGYEGPPPSESWPPARSAR